MNYINDIKKSLDTIQVLSYYGLAPNRSGFVRCPFHHEKTASMKVYSGDGGYYCFGCHQSGSIIDFVMNFFGLTLLESVQKLNDDFALGFPIDAKPDKRMALELARQQFVRKKAFSVQSEAKKHLYNELWELEGEYIRLRRNKAKFRPKNGDDEFHSLFVEALLMLPFVEYQIDQKEVEIYQHEKGSKCN